MWSPGIKSESPALQGGCLVTGPLGKSPSLWFWFALPMIDEVEHLLMLLVVWISSFMKCLFKSFALFSSVSSVFFISINRNALYILHTSLPIPGPTHCPCYSMGLIAFQVGAEWTSTWVGKSVLVEWMRTSCISVCFLAYINSCLKLKVGMGVNKEARGFFWGRWQHSEIELWQLALHNSRNH